MIVRMSAVPARPSRPERCSSVAASSAGGIPACSSSHSTRPGIDAPGAGRHHQPLERREAHRRVDRAAVEDGGQRRAGAEVAGHEAQAVGRAAEQLGRAPRRVRVRQAVEPVAAQVPALAPLRRAARRSRRRPAASRGTPCRSRRRPGRPAARRVTTSSAASDFGWWSGARSVSARSRATTAASMTTGLENCGAAVDDPVADRVDRPEAADRRRRPRRRRSTRAAPAGPPRPTTASSRVEHAQLEAARAGVDDQDPADAGASPPSVGHVQSRSRGRPRPRGACRRAPRSACRPSAGGRGRPGWPSPGTRSMTSMTRWKRSRSLSMTMSNGVVVVPSSL